MKTKISIYALMLLMFFAACKDVNKKSAQQEISEPEDIYTCSMHPQVHERHPGNCPICGMQLIKKNMASAGTSDIPLGTLLKPTNEFVVASVAVTTAQQKSMDMAVKAYGTIEYDTRSAASISARISGRIEKMYIRYRYQAVEKGQKIMDIYSPEILTAEQNLLFLFQHDASNASFIQAAKEKLLFMGVSEAQLKEVIQTGKPQYTVSIYSPFNGHVHDAGMVHEDLQAGNMAGNAEVTRELPLKEGMYVEKGQTILMIMDHHRVWAALQIFPPDQSQVKPGDKVTLIPETDTGVRIKGQIDQIEPFFRTNRKTLTARVYIDNMGMLPVGSQVSAVIYGKNEPRSWLPLSSVLSLGMHEAVFLKTKSGFAAHKITTGIRSGDEIEVLAGLGAKDTVAVNAQYFMDSESFIKTSSK
jgi:Cu(I)/Ag(I) efflux system membrane fusion protein